ncbi:MAG: TrmH family RNA methyltransferase [Candidatus Promineifilaceae bacterium]
MITSSSNPLVKRLKRLKHKKHRQAEAAYFAEGLRVVLAALEAGAPIERLVYSPELLHSRPAWQALERAQAAGVPAVELSAELFAAVSGRDGPAGLGAILRQAWVELDELPLAPDGLFAALFDVADPGNLGAILRSLDAVAGAGLVLVGATADPFHPTAVKASMGALFRLPLARVASAEALLGWAQPAGLQTVATSAHAETDYRQAAYRMPAVLLFGSEGEGLAPEVLTSAHLAVAIPMLGAATSLNLAVAAGLMFYQLRNPAEAHDRGEV